MLYCYNKLDYIVAFYNFNGKALVTKDGKTYFDKAHNDYLQILITEGIFCLITYIAKYVIIRIKVVESGYKRKEIYVILPIICYLIQRCP